jgi:hypothetical protein
LPRQTQSVAAAASIGALGHDKAVVRGSSGRIITTTKHVIMNRKIENLGYFMQLINYSFRQAQCQHQHSPSSNAFVFPYPLETFAVSSIQTAIADIGQLPWGKGASSAPMAQGIVYVIMHSETV